MRVTRMRTSTGARACRRMSCCGGCVRWGRGGTVVGRGGGRRRCTQLLQHGAHTRVIIQAQRLFEPLHSVRHVTSCTCSQTTLCGALCLLAVSLRHGVTEKRGEGECCCRRGTGVQCTSRLLLRSKRWRGAASKPCVCAAAAVKSADTPCLAGTITASGNGARQGAASSAHVDGDVGRHGSERRGRTTSCTVRPRDVLPAPPPRWRHVGARTHARTA